MKDKTRTLHERRFIRVSRSSGVINHLSANLEEMKVNVFGEQGAHNLTELLKTPAYCVVNMIQFSGYPHAYRYKVMATAFKGHKNRSKRTGTEKTTKKGMTVFFDVTPNGELKRKVKKHPCLTDLSKVLILFGVSSQVLGGELETQIYLG